MMGVVPTSLLGGVGTIWLLGTDDVYKLGRDLLRYGPLMFELWFRTFDRLENIVSTENEEAIRLLRRWGFTIGDRVQTYGGTEFLPFWLEKGR